MIEIDMIRANVCLSIECVPLLACRQDQFQIQNPHLLLVDQISFKFRTGAGLVICVEYLAAIGVWASHWLSIAAAVAVFAEAYDDAAAAENINENASFK